MDTDGNSPGPAAIRKFLALPDETGNVMTIAQVPGVKGSLGFWRSKMSEGHGGPTRITFEFLPE